MASTFSAITKVDGLPPKLWSVTPAGQKLRTNSTATSGASNPSSAGGGQGAIVDQRAFLLVERREIARSMYIAASTIAIAPTTDQPSRG